MVMWYNIFPSNWYAYSIDRTLTGTISPDQSGNEILLSDAAYQDVLFWVTLLLSRGYSQRILSLVDKAEVI